MNTIADIQELASKRVQEARVLLNNNLPEGAYYLAGYAAELTLKARICNLLDMDSFYAPADIKKVSGAYFTHDLGQLLTLSGWRKRLETEMSPSGGANLLLATNWQTICRWSEKKRYDCVITDVTPIPFLSIGRVDFLGWLVQRKPLAELLDTIALLRQSDCCPLKVVSVPV